MMISNFPESLNIYVFTTKYVLNEGSPIVYVSHDDDGDWQFLGKEKGLGEEDAKVISLGEMIEHDPSIKEIAHLPLGKKAIRENIYSPWSILD